MNRNWSQLKYGELTVPTITTIVPDLLAKVLLQVMAMQQQNQHPANNNPVPDVEILNTCCFYFEDQPLFVLCSL
ncbi:hypothetical protein MKW98_015012 [Papaver atlanticum]|uniref:Uncharacterized protein n=1 Tax=Papaver atlanticum TaxID=357466 RepID=A0AAD4S7R1_9MAGN|nr:hypothetical protein MKW98_015012 [Papaver atlanticum]